LALRRRFVAAGAAGATGERPSHRQANAILSIATPASHVGAFTVDSVTALASIPRGYARDIRRDRLLRRAGVDVIHILNLEIERHKARALAELLPREFFGFGWDYEGERPEPCLF
jgi:hypothetical protein